MRLFYFGCYQRAGHYFWLPGMRSADSLYPANLGLPWGEVEPVLCPGVPDPERYWERDRPEVEGEALLHHKDGWTALSFWDRSVDTRGACNSQFFAEGTRGFEEMVALAQAHFPEVWSRFTFTVRLTAGASGAGTHGREVASEEIR